MTGFAMILGGAVKGYGAGVLESARAKREAALQAIAEERADRRLATREGKGEYGTTADGESVFIQGDKAKPVTGADGKPIKLAGQKAGDAPAEVKTAEWLIQQGVAKDPTEAWKMVRQARDDPEKSRASILKAWMTTLKPEFGNVDGDKLQEEALRRTEETMRFLDGEDTPAGTKAPSKRPAGVSDADIAAQAKQAIADGADKAAVRSRLLEMGVDPAAAGL